MAEPLSALDPIWDAVFEIADEDSVKGHIDYSGKRDMSGIGIIRFSLDGIRISVDIYMTEDEIPSTE